MGRWVRQGDMGRKAAGLACLALLSAACDSPPPPALDLPARSVDAMGGQELAHELGGLDLGAREARIYREIAGGNVPTWMRELRPVRLREQLDGVEHDLTFWVTPDYLSIGSDEDYLLVPLSPRTAQRVADLVGGSLPTPRMVDAIWRAAERRLSPQRLAPRDSIESVRSVEYYDRHTSVILAQRMLKGTPAGAFVAGHKKDVVLSPELETNPGKVAVYGMHGPDGTPTQRLSTVAEEGFVYYNHGVRLVLRDVVVDGITRDLAELLVDPAWAPLLSRAGAMQRAGYPLREEAVDAQD